MLFSHYSDKKLDILDPNFCGTSHMNGTEKRVKENNPNLFVNRLYAYKGDVPKQEMRLGNIKHIILYPYE